MGQFNHGCSSTIIIMFGWYECIPTKMRRTISDQLCMEYYQSRVIPNGVRTWWNILVVMASMKGFISISGRMHDWINIAQPSTTR